MRDQVIDLLKNNIIKLTQLKENNYYTMLNEIDRLKKSNSILGSQLFDLEQKEKKNR
jgi:hypothetical protein